MKKINFFIKGLISAVATFVYVSAVSWLLFDGQNIFGKPPSFFIPLFMLLLFIVSAAITGLLVLGKPIHLYLSGLKKEAFTLLFATLAWLVIFLGIVAAFLLK